MKWHSIKDIIPQHKETVLAATNKGFSVVIFVDMYEVTKSVEQAGFLNLSSDHDSYAFCSQEFGIHTISGVTHWLRLPDINTEFWKIE